MISAPRRPMRDPGGRPSLEPRLPREVGARRTLRPRGPLRPTVRPPLPQAPLPPRVNVPTPWWEVGLEMLASAATLETAVAAVFLAPMGIVADHYLDHKEELERKPLFTPCGSEPRLRESEMGRERQLSDMERMRRNLRWYADDDHVRGKLLDRDIDALKALVADMGRKDQIRELRTRLNGMNPGSTEAQGLRQEIAALEAEGARPVVSSTAVRAHSHGAGAAPAAAQSTGAASPDSRADPETLDELLAALHERQLSLRVDGYVQRLFAKNPEGARLIVRLALVNDEDLRTLQTYAGNGHVPTDAQLERLDSFLTTMADHGVRVTGSVVATMTDARNPFIQSMAMHYAEGAMRLHLSADQLWVAFPGQPVQHYDHIVYRQRTAAQVGISGDVVNQMFFWNVPSIRHRAFYRHLHIAFQVADGLPRPALADVAARVVMPEWLDHLQLSYVTVAPAGSVAVVETRSLTRAVTRELPRVNHLTDLDQLLEKLEFADVYDRFLDIVGTHALVYPQVPSLHYAVGFDPYKIPAAIRHITQEMLLKGPLSSKVSPENREMLAMTTLIQFVRSAALGTLFSAGQDGASAEMRTQDIKQDGAARRLRLQEDVRVLSDTLTEWIGDVRENGRHRLAVDAYLALVHSGLQALDPQVVRKFIPQSDHWTASDQKFVYRLLLNPDTPLAVVTEALAHLHPLILADAVHVTSDTPADVISLVLSGIEILAYHQALSGSETKMVAMLARRLMTAALPEIQKWAIIAYVAVVRSGYLSDQDVRLGVADMDSVANRTPGLTGAVDGALLMLGAWVPKDMPAYARVAQAEFHIEESGGDRMCRVPLEVLRRPFIAVPPLSKPGWSRVWQSLEQMAETRDPALSVAAHAFHLSLSTLWSPMVDAAKLVRELHEKMERGSDAAYLQQQVQVLEVFLTSARRHQLWMQIAQGGDEQTKHHLVALLEQRLQGDGTDGELTQIQEVRNAALGLPAMSVEESQLERLYLETLRKRMAGEDGYHPTWGGTLNIEYYRNPHKISNETRAHYFTRVLTASRPVAGVTLAAQQLQALNDLWVLSQSDPSSERGRFIYRHIAPLLDSDNDEVAYGAAKVATALRRLGVEADDNVKVQYALLRPELNADRGTHIYPGTDKDKLMAFELILRHKMVTPVEIGGAAALVRRAIARGGIEEVQVGLALAPSVVKSGKLDSAQVDDIIQSIVDRLGITSTESLRNSCLSALRPLTPHIVPGHPIHRQLQRVTSTLLQPWKKRAQRVLREIEKP